MRAKKARTVEIPLTQGLVALIDESDYAAVNAHSWCLQQYKNKQVSTKVYAKCSYQGTQITMHRFILNPPKGVSVDHVNGNGLDNRRTNLRLANKSANAANRPKDRVKKATSKFKGVCFPKKLGRWVARIHVYGKAIHLGCFDIETDAALAYNKAALEYFGEFACLNQLP